MTALRVARGFTGRPQVVKFAGNYHGHADALLAESGSGVATLGLPGLGRGHRRAGRRHARRALQRRARRSTSDVACVIVEPVAANMGLVPPAPGFLEGLRAECDRVGALLVFDEVITGFRVGVRRRPGAASACGPTSPPSARSSAAASTSAPTAAGPTSCRSSPRSGPCTRPARCRGTRSPPRPASPRSSTSTPPPTRRSRRPRRAVADGARATPSPAPGIAAVVPRSPRSSACFLGDRRRRRLRRRPSAPTPPATPRFFHALLAAASPSRPGAYEVLFPGLAHSDDVVDELVATPREQPSTISGRHAGACC